MLRSSNSATDADCRCSVGFLVLAGSQRDDGRALALVAARPLRRAAQVVHVDDVVALEHARCPVPRERHHRVRRDAAADQVAHAGAPEIMHDAAGEAELAARLRPELAEVPDAPAGAMEDERAVQATRLPAAGHHVGELAAIDREHPAVPVLAPLGSEPDDALAPVVVAPLEGAYLADAPRAEEQEPDEVADRVGQPLREGLHLFAREEAAADAALVGGQAVDLGTAVRRQAVRLDRERERPAEERDLHVDRRRRRPSKPARVDVPLHPVPGDRNGFRVFVLAGAPRKDILLGKNLALFPFALGLGVIGTVALQFAYPMRIDHFLAAMVQIISMYLIFSFVLNFLSMLSPVTLASGSLKPAQPKGVAILVHLLFFFLLLPMALGATLIPLGIEFLFPYLPVYLLLTLAEFLIIAYLYDHGLGLQARILQSREQKILEIVTARVQ